jgi:hypothetical protein
LNLLKVLDRHFSMADPTFWGVATSLLRLLFASCTHKAIMEATDEQETPITQRSAEENVEVFGKKHIQHLLTGFEASGLAREEFNLQSYFSLHEDQYGAPGSERRRSVSKRWFKIKLLPIDKYVPYLKAYEVVPGIKTKILQLGAEANKPPPSLKKLPAKKQNQVAFKEKMAPDDASTASSTGSHASSSSGSSGSSTISSKQKSRSSRASRRSGRSNHKKQSGRKGNRKKLPPKGTPGKKDNSGALTPPILEFSNITVNDGSPYKPRTIFGAWGGGVPSPQQVEKKH